MTEDRETTQPLPCPVCGSEDFTWGRLLSQYKVVFEPNEKKFLALTNEVPVHARRCDQCQNVLLFAQRK